MTRFFFKANKLCGCYLIQTHVDPETQKTSCILISCIPSSTHLVLLEAFLCPIFLRAFFLSPVSDIILLHPDLKMNSNCLSLKVLNFKFPYGHICI